MSESSPTPDPAIVECALCVRNGREDSVALYDCKACGRPICDACAAAAPDWRFACLDCADPVGWYDLTRPTTDPSDDPWAPG